MLNGEQKLRDLGFKRIKRRRYCLLEDFEIWEKGKNKIYFTLFNEKLKFSSLLPLNLEEFTATLSRFRELSKKDCAKILKRAKQLIEYIEKKEVI